MAGARYLGKKLEGMISTKASLMKVQYFCSPYIASRRYKSTIDEYVEESAKEGIRKATEIADAAKQNLDGAWDSTKANENENVEDKVVAEIKKLDGPVDTVEYRNMHDSNL